MKNVERKIDFHTLIENLSYELKLEKGKNDLLLTFQNATFETLTEVAFEARGYDYFGELISTESKEYFLIQLKNLNLKPGQCVVNYKIQVSKSIRQLDLKQSYVIDMTGQKEIYKESEYQIYYYDKFFPDSYKDKKVLDVLKKFNPSATCYPLETQAGWICCCGYLNKTENKRCKYCQKIKDEVFLECSQKSVEEKIAAEEKEFNQRMEKRMLERDRRETKELILFIIRFITVIILIILIFAIIIHFRTG